MMTTIIIEILSWVFDGIEGKNYIILNTLFNSLLFIISTSAVGLWVSYIDYKIFKDEKRIRKFFWYQYAIISSIIIVIINLFTPIIFEISSNNIYSRLPLISINFIVAYLLLLYSNILAFVHRKQLKSNMLNIVVLSLLIPAIASIFQLLNYGLILMWPAMVGSILLTYLFLETQSNSRDYLTGLYNRSKIDEYVKRSISNDEEFTIIMIDLDDYKQINDKYGHSKGDTVITIFGNLLKDIIGDSGKVARYGGDEFIIILYHTKDKEIKEYKTTLLKRLYEYEDEVISNLKFSFGYSSRTQKNNKSFQKLLTESDDLMYKNKAENKNFKRRKSDR
jgi:diguanylate cyclase (GGDEF)-like protein